MMTCMAARRAIVLSAAAFLRVLSFLPPGCSPPTATLGISRPAGPAASQPATAEADDHPPIAIDLTLREPGWITLVIEGPDGRRVRNLIGETPLPAGRHVVYWDGLDDLARDTNAAAHAVYHIPGRLVGPGEYRIRGLYRKAIDLRYEFTVYNPGDPPWRTKDTSSEWLTNHTPPSAVCFVPAGQAPARGSASPGPPGRPGPAGPPGRPGSPPQVLIGSFVAEGGSGLAWVDLTGRKLHGQMWLGGVWTGSACLARDAGDRPLPDVYAYSGTAWEGDGYNKNQPELRLHKLVRGAGKQAAPRDSRFGYGEDPPILTPTFKFPAKDKTGLGGIAVWNGILVVSLPKLNQLLFVDVAQGKALGTAPLGDGRGLAFDASGRLLALSGKRLLRFRLPPAEQLARRLTPVPATQPATMATTQPQVETRAANGTGGDRQGLEDLAEPVPIDGLEDPQQIALDPDGRIYISDRGGSHQVKVFAPEGKPLRRIGRAGTPKAGPYDPMHMNNPKGLAITDEGHLWVAEEDFQPKRVSVWTLDGRLVRAFYGPPVYGGGGTIDPQDKTLFYHHGMTFRLDWQAGTGQVIFIHHRPGPDDLKTPAGWDGGTPETPIHFRGRRFLTNVFTSHPTNGSSTAMLWLDRGGLAVPAAGLGRAAGWPLLKGEDFAARLPKDLDPKKVDWGKLLFAWSDLSGDAKVQPEEVSFAAGSAGSGMTVSPDLSIVTGEAVRFAPVRFTPAGVPVYDLGRPEALVPDPQRPTSTGGGQVLYGRDGWTVLTVAPKPFAPQSMGGVQKGAAVWSYPSLWPGLHASHIAPMPELPGELIGTTRLLGPLFAPPRGQAGEMWAVNGNKGNVYLLTTDGLFVATLFRDCRIPKAAWSMPKAQRGMPLSDATNGEESFFPTITRTADGNVYLVTNHPSIIRIDGLETVERIAPISLNVTSGMLAACREHFLRAEARRQERDKARRDEKLIVAIRSAPPAVDGKLDDWAAARWVTVDIRHKQLGDWARKEQRTEAAACVAGDRLYAAFRTGEPEMLRNAGTSMPNFFKTGGALDLMIGSDPKADPKRPAAVAGDVRLLAAMVKGKPAAVLYRPVAPGTKGEPVLFGSPLRTVAFDRVEEVTKDIELARGAEGEFELSVPLALLGLKPADGMVIRGDVGVLRGSEFQTTQRAYWHNKASGLTSDIPSEAELTPRLWGDWEFRKD